jgi:hypothetical protein
MMARWISLAPSQVRGLCMLDLDLAPLVGPAGTALCSTVLIAQSNTSRSRAAAAGHGRGSDRGTQGRHADLLVT